jgi:hypothetical protein
MTQPASTAAREQIIDTMIELRRLSNSHRVIVAGGSIEVTYLALHRRGFFRVTTTGICGVVAVLIDSREGGRPTDTFGFGGPSVACRARTAISWQQAASVC